MKVLCYGVVGVDILLQIGEYPEANGHTRVRQETVTVGGEAANTAIRLDQLGVDVILMGNPVGDDAYGELFTARLSQSGVDCRIETEAGITGHAFVISDADENRTILGAFGPLSGPDVPDELLDAVDLVTVDPFVEGAVRLAEESRERGLPVISIEVEKGDALSGVSTGVINSAARLRRHGISDHAGVANKLLDAGVEWTIVTRGGEGADLYGPSGMSHHPAVEVGVVDTTGAGDAFRAGLIRGILEGSELAEAVRTAGEVASLSCCYTGGCGGDVSASRPGRPPRSA